MKPESSRFAETLRGQWVVVDQGDWWVGWVHNPCRCKGGSLSEYSGGLLGGRVKKRILENL